MKELISNINIMLLSGITAIEFDDVFFDASRIEGITKLIDAAISTVHDTILNPVKWIAFENSFPITHTQIDTHTAHRHTHRYMDRQTHRHRETNGQADREIERE